jgi:hypothetical protein
MAGAIGGRQARAQAAPALVAVVLDTSASLSEADLARSRDLASALLARLPAGSEVAVFSFDDQSRLLLPRSSSAADVRRALGRVRRTGRFTALNDALYDSSRYLRDAEADRRAIVLITDGHDENSSLTLEDGLRVAQEARIPVLAVGLGAVHDRVLRRIAKLTGGEYVPAARANGAALADRIAAPPPPASAGSTPRGAAGGASREPPGAGSVPAPPAAPLTAAPAGRSRGVLLAGLLLAGLAAAGVGAWALRNRSAPRCPSCGHDLPDALSACTFCGIEARPDASAGDTLRGELSPTVLERLNVTEEYLEKTITLRERPVLTITRGPGTGDLFELNQTTSTSIGRARANDIVLKDVSISGQHCRIRPENGGFVLHDLKSTNGTFVNEKRVTRHPLADGDLVQIGETVMQYKTEHHRAS